jgi:hypothetical protein
MDLKSGYLFTKKELEVIIESYKSIVPLLDTTISSKQRQALYKKYKLYYKQLNELLFYKQLRKENTIAELLEIKTGIKVRAQSLNRIKINKVTKDRKLSNEVYTKLMKSLRQKIIKLEDIIGDSESFTFKDGSKTLYYFVLEKQLF